MKNAILLHGLLGEKEYYDANAPSASNGHWLPWLQKQLLVKGIKADTPEVPTPFAMKWDDWVKEVERFEINQDSVLVGHSMGGGFWVRYLSEHPEIKVGKVVLVAPWLNVDHEVDSDFFDFDLRSEITTQADSFLIFASDNDGQDIKLSVDLLKRELDGVVVREFHKYGHFCYSDLGTDAFPELLEACV